MFTITAAFTAFLENLKGQSFCNRRNYQQRLAGFLASYGHCRPEEVQPAHINQWLSGLDPAFAPATLAGYRQAIKGFFNWCYKQGIVNSSPAAHIVTGKYIAGRPRLPAESSVAHLATLASAWLDSSKPLLVRDGLVFLLSYGAGPRISEIRNLRYSAIQSALANGPDNHQVYHVNSNGKEGTINILFGNLAAAGFAKWLQLRPLANNDFVFVSLHYPYNQLSRSGITKCYQRLAAAAGIDHAVLSQALRHRAGHQTTRRHGPKVAAMLLNHRDWQTASTAVAFYHHPDEEDVSIAANDLITIDPEELQQMARLFGLG